MENQFNDTQDSKTEITLPQKNVKGLPLIALGLSLAPLIFGILFSGLTLFPIYTLLLIISPIVGLVMGVASLKLGKRGMGMIGMIASIIAIAIPLAFAALIITFFVGVSTGMISLM